MRRRATDDGSSAVAGGGWTLVVPVSGLATAKSRLAVELDPRARATLVLAMLTDVLSVARATPGVAALVVVTPDPRVAAHARDLGARVVADPPVTAGAPGGPTSDSLDRALRTALAANDAGAVGIGVVAADLPELRPPALGRILAAASEAVGRPIPYRVGARRAGDVPASYADASLAAELLGWSAHRTMTEMCADAWRWQSQNPDGYRTA